MIKLRFIVLHVKWLIYLEVVPVRNHRNTRVHSLWFSGDSCCNSCPVVNRKASSFSRWNPAWSEYPQCCFKHIFLLPPNKSDFLGIKSLHWAFRKEIILIKNSFRGRYMATNSSGVMTAINGGKLREPLTELLYGAAYEAYPWCFL